jgi:hypothetical protein
MDAIPPALLNGVGVAGLLVGLFWMLASGRIVTRREHEGRVADKDAQIADLRKANDVKDAQLEKLTSDVATTVIRVLESIENLARGRSQ